MRVTTMREVALLAALFTIGASCRAAGFEAARTAVDEIPWPADSSPQEGTAMRRGLQTVVVAGDAKSQGLYTMMVRLPPNTKIPPHSHPDERSCFVLSGTWYFAYGDVRDDAQLKTLPPGSHYTEPAGMTHFAETRDETVVAACSAIGPTGTTFVNPADDPRNR